MVETSPELLSLCDPYTGYTALHWAAKVSSILWPIYKTSLSHFQHDNDHLIKSLLRFTCDINRQSNGGQGQWENDSGNNTISLSGYTPLHLAAINESQKVSTSTFINLNFFEKFDVWRVRTEHNALLSILLCLFWLSHTGYSKSALFQAFSTLMMDFKADRKIRDNSGKTATSYLKNVITSSVELKKGIAKNYVIKNYN